MGELWSSDDVFEQEVEVHNSVHFGLRYGFACSVSFAFSSGEDGALRYHSELEKASSHQQVPSAGDSKVLTTQNQNQKCLKLVRTNSSQISNWSSNWYSKVLTK